MAHPRKLVRHAIVARLLGVTIAGVRVQPTRIEPHRKTQLPAIGVYTLRETIDVTASALTAPRLLSRNLHVEVAAWVTHSLTAPADDALDDIAEQIEAALGADRYLGGRVAGLVKDTILESTEIRIVAGEGNDPEVGIITLTYAVSYNTDDASMSPDDFLRAHTTTKLPTAEVANAAIDDINVRSAP